MGPPLPALAGRGTERGRSFGLSAADNLLAQRLRFTRFILRAIAVLGVKDKRFASRAKASSEKNLQTRSYGSRSLTPPRGDGFLATKTFC